MKLPVKVLGMCGSLRTQSTNLFSCRVARRRDTVDAPRPRRSALKFMKSQAPKLGMEMEIAELKEVPFFNADTEDDKNAATVKLLEQFKDADAFVLASPEYNYSITPALKNALDWGSRMPGNEGFKSKAASMISCGGGFRGGRSQYHLRQVCVFLDLFVLNKPEVFLSAFDGTFDKETAELVSTDKQELLVQQLGALKDLSLKLNPPSEPEL